MNVAPVTVARVTSQMSGSLLLGNLQSNQLDLLEVQRQISTMQKLNRSSDDPAATLGIERLRQQLSANTQYGTDLNTANSFMNTADEAMGSLSTLLTQALQVANSQVGVTSSADERQSQATVVDSLLSQAMDLANRKYQGQSVFGGANATQDAFVGVAGGYEYQGSTTGQSMMTASGQNLEFTINGNDVFGGESNQVVGNKDLQPSFSANTRISDLGGARNQGVTLGPINVTSNGITTQVDLSHAATVDDVKQLIQAALTAAGGGATITDFQDTLGFTAGPSSNLTISDVGSGTTAVDLGIAMTVPAGGGNGGPSTNLRVTGLTPLSYLNGNAGVHAAGITITNGSLSSTISFAGLNTVQDVLNAINNSGMHVRAEINEAGTGINVVNLLSGSGMTIGENGGTSAQDLGIRSLTSTTLLSDLNNGTGITPSAKNLPGPTGDLIITKTDGSTFTIKTDGMKNTVDLANAINAATGNGTVTATPNSTGNGITLNDASGGTGNLTVKGASNFVSNGTDFGIINNAPSGATIVGGNATFSTDDVRITRRDGTSFTVSFAGLTTIQQVMDAINTATGNTTPGAKVTASLTTQGNGIVLVDDTTGSGVLSVSSVNASQAGAQLGLVKTASAGNPAVIAGDDVNPISPRGIFTSLLTLAKALRSNDSNGISAAAAMLQQDSQRVVTIRGQVGARNKDIQSRLDQVDSDKIQLTNSLSLLADTDMTEAITRYQTLQTAYEASLKVSSTTQNLSLLDYLK